MPPGGDRFQAPASQFLLLLGLAVPMEKPAYFQLLEKQSCWLHGTSGQCLQEENSTIPTHLLPLVTYPQESQSSGMEGSQQPSP